MSIFCHLRKESKPEVTSDRGLHFEDTAEHSDDSGIDHILDWRAVSKGETSCSAGLLGWFILWGEVWNQYGIYMSWRNPVRTVPAVTCSACYRDRSFLLQDPFGGLPIHVVSWLQCSMLVCTCRSSISKSLWMALVWCSKFRISRNFTKFHGISRSSQLLMDFLNQLLDMQVVLTTSHTSMFSSEQDFCRISATWNFVKFREITMIDQSMLTRFVKFREISWNVFWMDPRWFLDLSLNASWL